MAFESGQFTAKTPHLALLWILTHDHFEAGTEWKDGRATHTFYRNHFDRLRVPIGMKGFHSKIKPNPRPHDSRMYTVTKHGREWLRAEGFTWNRKDHP